MRGLDAADVDNQRHMAASWMWLDDDGTWSSDCTDGLGAGVPILPAVVPEVM